MIDVVANVLAFLQSHWIETNPPLADIHWAHGFGFDENVGSKYIQILVDDLLNVPNAPAYAHVVSRTKKVDHYIVISVFLRPISYMPATLETARASFMNMMKEISRILNVGRYLVNQITRVELSAWDIQTKREEEPVVFEARQIIDCVYFLTETEFSQTEFPFIWLS